MLNGCEKGLIDNFRQLGCNGLADKLDTALSSRHVASSELFSVMSSVTEAELLDQKQARADRLLRMAVLESTKKVMVPFSVDSYSWSERDIRKPRYS